CDVDADTIDVKLSYYYIGHFSRFIRPGARRILVSKYSPDIEATAFRNPDGSRVLVLLNRSEREVDFVLSTEGKNSGRMKIGKHSIMTCCWE
ncbi:MAG: glucosylceramidase, partial [Lachnospiraceae bacterium]|nr:glucosylceramidase [Lachnospiraceae bacterium]